MHVCWKGCEQDEDVADRLPGEFNGRPGSQVKDPARTQVTHLSIQQRHPVAQDGRLALMMPAQAPGHLAALDASCVRRIAVSRFEQFILRMDVEIQSHIQQMEKRRERFHGEGIGSACGSAFHPTVRKKGVSEQRLRGATTLVARYGLAPMAILSRPERRVRVAVWGLPSRVGVWYRRTGMHQK